MEIQKGLANIGRAINDVVDDVKEAAETALEKVGVLSEGEPSTVSAPADNFTTAGTAVAREFAEGQSQATVRGDASLQDELQSARVGVNIGRGAGTSTPGQGRNTTDGLKRSATGPIASSDWDRPEQIVGNLTQNPASGDTVTSTQRCGAANVLASRIMNGPEETASFLESVADNASSSRLTDAQRTELRGIAGDVRNRSATYEQLGRAQGLLFRAGNRETDAMSAIDAASQSGNLNPGELRQLGRLRGRMEAEMPFNGQEVRQLSQLLSKARGEQVNVVAGRDVQRPNEPYLAVEVTGSATETDRSGLRDAELRDLGAMGGAPGRVVEPNYASRHPLNDILTDLQPGESATLRVAHTAEGYDANHYITVGRRPNGQAYIYNSDPSKDQYTLFTGGRGPAQPESFRQQMTAYDNLLRSDIDEVAPAIVY